MSAIVHVGNVLDILPTLEAGSVNCVVTSPPYWGLRSYLPADDEMKSAELGCEPTPELYVANMVAVFRELRRVLRDDGTLWLNLGDSYQGGGGGNYGDSKSTRTHREHLTNVRNRIELEGIKAKDLVGIPWMVAFALRADGWYLRSDIIWAKPNPMPESVTDRPTKAHEYLFLLTKSARYWYDAEAIRDSFADDRMGCPGGGTRNYAPGDRNDATDSNVLVWNADGNTRGRNRRTVWTIATQPFKEAHFATMPEKLVEPCVLAGCPAKTCAKCGTVLDSYTHTTRRSRTNEVPVSGVRGGVHGVSVEGGPDEVLQPGMHERLPQEDAAGHAMHGVREADGDRSASEGQAVLLTDMCEPGDGQEQRFDKGLCDEREGLQADSRPTASDGESRGLRHGASTSDGRSPGQDADGERDRSSQERAACGQPARELGTHAEDDARPPATTEAQADTVPPLRRTDSPAPPRCPSCGSTDSTAGVVLDPFCGSGTTGAVACRLGRNFVGVELSPEYAEMAERRIAPHRDQMQLAVTT